MSPIVNGPIRAAMLLTWSQGQPKQACLVPPPKQTLVVYTRGRALSTRLCRPGLQTVLCFFLEGKVGCDICGESVEWTWGILISCVAYEWIFRPFAVWSVDRRKNAICTRPKQCSVVFCYAAVESLKLELNQMKLSGRVESNKPLDYIGSSHALRPNWIK